jgi:hypothetical protein
MPVAKPGPLAQLGEGAREVLGIERRSDLTGEYQSVVAPDGTGCQLALSLSVMLAQLR